MVTIEEFEQTLKEVLEENLFNGERWVMQKRIKWRFRGTPVSQLPMEAYEYKLLKNSEKEKEECFVYYVLELVCKKYYDVLEVSYGNDSYGANILRESNVYYDRLKRFYLSPFNKEVMQTIIGHIILELRPSFFTYT